MTALSIQSILPDNGSGRLVFIVELVAQGEKSNADRLPLARHEIETLRNIAHMLAQAMAATAQSMEAQIGLIGLSKSVATLARNFGSYRADRPAGEQAKTIHENARDVKQSIAQALKSLEGVKADDKMVMLKNLMKENLRQLGELEPKGKEGSRIVRFVVPRGDKNAAADIKRVPIGKKDGAKIISFSKAAASSGPAAEALFPSKPSPLSRAKGAERSNFSILAKTELKKAVLPAREITGKADPVSGKAAALTVSDKKSAMTGLPAQKNNLSAEAKNLSAPGSAKAALAATKRAKGKSAALSGQGRQALPTPASAKTPESRRFPTPRLRGTGPFFAATESGNAGQTAGFSSPNATASTHAISPAAPPQAAAPPLSSVQDGQQKIETRANAPAAKMIEMRPATRTGAPVTEISPVPLVQRQPESKLLATVPAQEILVTPPSLADTPMPPALAAPAQTTLSSTTETGGNTVDVAPPAIENPTRDITAAATTASVTEGTPSAAPASNQQQAGSAQEQINHAEFRQAAQEIVTVDQRLAEVNRHITELKNTVGDSYKTTEAYKDLTDQRKSIMAEKKKEHEQAAKEGKAPDRPPPPCPGGDCEKCRLCL